MWRDWALVAVLVPAALLEGLLEAQVALRALTVVVSVGLVPALLWRRSRPLLMVALAFGTCCVVTLATAGDAPRQDVLAYQLLLPYALFRWGSGREVVTGAVLVYGTAGICLVAVSPTAADVIGGYAVLSAACALGGAFRYRAGARSRELDQAKLRERERLARDLHDTVAHHVSAIAIRAQAGLATSGPDPGAAADALRVIELEASRTLAEMRSMVRALRRDEPPGPAELAPSPTVADIVALAGPVRGGPRVEVAVDGDVGDLSPTVAAAVYRLAQESVTNARRHARHASRIEIRVAADETSVRLRVRDDGDTSALRPPAAPGFGLTGMIERARLLGGTCEAGPDPERGWTVAAELPRAGWAT